MPIVLGAVGLALGVYLIVRYWPTVHADGITDHLLWGASGAPGVLLMVACVVLAVGTVISFRFEGLVRRWASKRRPAGASLDFLGVPMQSASESMSDVASAAQRPVMFALLSVWAATAEEFFYRGAVLLGSVDTGWLVGSFLLQAAAYGVSHLAFGWQAVLGKAAFGLVLGAGALLGGLIPVVLAHWGYQWLVVRQFRGGRYGTAA